MKRIACLLASICTISGCATYRPLVDRRSIDDPQRYEYDLADCQAYARRVDPVASAGAGAFLGALFGAALGAAVGDHYVARDLATYGAVEGAAVGATGGANAQVNIIRNCMSDRGYAVLN